MNIYSFGIMGREEQATAEELRHLREQAKKYEKVLARGRKGSKRYRDTHTEQVNAAAREYYYIKKEKMSPEEKQRKLDYIKQWQQDHAENRRAAARKYYETHKEQKAEYSKKYKREHKEWLGEKDKERHRVWRVNNPEKFRAIQKKSYEKRKHDPEFIRKRKEYDAKRRLENPNWYKKYTERRIKFKGKTVSVGVKVKTGTCSLCKTKGRTEMHHIKYHDDDPLKDTIEVCSRCHKGEHKRT